MYREIKFRAWDGKAMNYAPKLTDGSDGGETAYVDINSAIDDSCGLNYYTELMQFTGLTDIDGNEVYEYDVIKNTDTGVTALVYWNTEKAQFYVRYHDEYQQTFPLCDTIGNLYCVIGNMHEHPHLMYTQPL